MSSASRPASQLPATADNEHERKSLNDLINLVYDSVLDHSDWESAFAGITCYVGGAGAGLFVKDHNSEHVRVPSLFGVVPLPPRALFGQMYPILAGHFLSEPAQPVATSDLVPFDELVRTELYRTWAEPQGLVDFVSAVLDRSAAGVAIFGVFRHEQHGLADDDARRRMRLIAPHLRRAMLIVRKTAEAATLADTLDGLSAGLCLVDAGGRIVHVNAAAQAILDADDILRSLNGKLVARDAQADRTLQEVFAAAGQGDQALGTKGIAVPLTGEDGERYVAHALPLGSGARQRAGTAHTAAAALFIHRAMPAIPARPEVIGEAFKLTPAELRVLLAIVELGSVSEVAAAFGLGDATIRTHVSHVFEKTGAKRQADLVKLVTGYATPLAD